MQKAIYPGTFDPITNGHLDLIQRAAKLFDELVIAVAASSQKKPLFSLAERKNLLEEILVDFRNVKIIEFDGLLIDCAKQNQASVLIRSMRSSVDYDFELQNALMNRAMASDIETLFLIPDPKVMHISSTLVKQIASLGQSTDAFVPTLIERALAEKFVSS